jgi:hypothetical protein
VANRAGPRPGSGCGGVPTAGSSGQKGWTFVSHRIPDTLSAEPTETWMRSPTPVLTERSKERQECRFALSALLSWREPDDKSLKLTPRVRPWFGAGPVGGARCALVIGRRSLAHRSLVWISGPAAGEGIGVAAWRGARRA